MDAQPFDYGSLIRQGQAIVPDFAAEQAKRQMMALQRMQVALQVDQARREQQDAQAFDEDLDGVLANPNADAYSRLILKHPKMADKVKAAWSVMDESRQKADLTQMGEIYSAAANNRFDLAASNLKRRIQANRAAGHPDDPDDTAMLAMLESGDPEQQKKAKGMLGVVLSAITGPEKFGSTLGTINEGEGDFTLGPGGIRYDHEGNVLAAAPFAPRPLTVEPGKDIVEYQPGQSGSGSLGPIAFSQPAREVASTLASAGIPKHVVAGFLGNFHVEGGYEGAPGDGGTASGIAQWHPDRQANFQRVIGKPVTEASPAEQARFVAWEMQNPEAAGMTVAQRDAILNSKTAAQAAALIDQYYERSSGEHRTKRMAAAQSFFSAPASGGPVQIRSKQEYDKLAKGAQYTAPDGSLRVKG
jgi:hypothetical protein